MELRVREISARNKTLELMTFKNVTEIYTYVFRQVLRLSLQIDVFRTILSQHKGRNPGTSWEMHNLGLLTSFLGEPSPG